MTTTIRIPLGRLMMTAGVAALVKAQPALSAQIPAWLGRHAENDCPHLSDHDRAANDWAIRECGRVLTSWPLSADGDERLWIMTEHDRSMTTVLLPSEY